MSTIGALIDRVFREFLHPLDDFPRHVPLETGISDSDTSIVYEDGYLTPEETDLIDTGGKFQLGRELMMATAINTGTQTLTVSAATRGILGTTAAAHTAGDFIYLDPPYTRQAVYDAIVGGIPTFEPEIYQVLSREVWYMGYPEEIPAGAFEIIESKYWDGTGWCPGGGGELIEGDPDTNSGISVQLTAPYGTRNFIRYKAPFGSVTDETTTLASLGLTTEMHYPLMLEAAARIMATVDIKPATQEFIAQSIETQGFPVASGERIRNALLRYKDHLMESIEGKQKQRDPIDVAYMAAYPGGPQ